MDREYIKKVVRNILIKKQIEDSGIYYVPVAIQQACTPHGRIWRNYSAKDMN